MPLFEGQTDEEIEANIQGVKDTADAAQPKTGNTFTVATLPAAADNVGRVVYCSDGAAGSPTAVISDGTNWKVAGTLGATAAAAL